jgi:hypothetical protein
MDVSRVLIAEGGNVATQLFSFKREKDLNYLSESQRLGRYVPIHRPHKWGNPFLIGVHGDRPTVVAKYREWLPTQTELIASLPELVDKDLWCFCTPLLCHGDPIIELLKERGLI